MSFRYTSKHFAILAVGFLFSTASFAQNPDAELKSKYPKAKKVEWSVDKNGYHEAEFKMNDTWYRADFTKDGKWIETERNVEWKDLPPAVKHTAKKEDDKDDLSEIEEVHHHKIGWFYDVEFKKKKGKYDIMISPDGMIIPDLKH